MVVSHLLKGQLGCGSGREGRKLWEYDLSLALLRVQVPGQTWQESQI